MQSIPTGSYFSWPKRPRADRCGQRPLDQLQYPLKTPAETPPPVRADRFANAHKIFSVDYLANNGQTATGDGVRLRTISRLHALNRRIKVINLKQVNACI